MLKFIAALVCLLSFAARADETVTLIAGVENADTITLEKGESAKLLYVATPTVLSGNPATNIADATFRVVKSGLDVELKSFSHIRQGDVNPISVVVLPLEIAGPATIQVKNNIGLTFSTFSVKRVGVASNVAGIPIEAGSNFNVILESSSDQVNWTPANPGTYTGTETKRFFRTRIVKQ